MKKLASILAVAATVFAAPALAQEWPQQNIRIVVAFGPGGGTDIIARVLAESMQQKLGKPVVIENKPGAGGLLGNDVVAKASPDGYTLGIMTAGQIIASVTKKAVPYDTLTAFAPVGQIATAGLMIVARADFPANDVKALVAAAKADPNKVVFASPGFAATQHFAGELFMQTAGIKLLHVPFKTTPEAINAVLGKHADILFDTVPAVIGQVKNGQMKALAITGKDRFEGAPDVAPAIESGVLPGYDVATWYGMFAPAGTPPAVIAKLNAAARTAVETDAVKKRFGELSTVAPDPEEHSPDVLQKLVTRDVEKYRKMLADDAK